MLRIANCVECKKEINKDEEGFYLTHRLGEYVCEGCQKKKTI